MTRKAGMVHAMCSNAGLFKKLSADIMPDVEVVHLVDEGLPSMSAKSLHQSVVRRLEIWPITPCPDESSDLKPV